MKKLIVSLLVVMSLTSVGLSQDPVEKKLSPLEKILLKKMFKPFEMTLSKKVFDIQKDEYNFKTFESSHYNEAKVIGQCTILTQSFSFIQENDDKFDKSTYEYGNFFHHSEKKIRFLNAVTNDNKKKSCHFILHTDENTYSVFIISAKKDFDELFKLVKQSVIELKRK